MYVGLSQRAKVMRSQIPHPLLDRRATAPSGAALLEYRAQRSDFTLESHAIETRIECNPVGFWRRYTIDVSKSWHVAWWMTQLGVSETELRDAVAVVGPFANDVVACLFKRKVTAT